MDRDFEPRGNVHIDQDAVAPKQMRTLAKTPLDNQFRIILKSDPDLSEQFIRVSLNLSQDFIEMDVVENKKWQVLDWLLSLKEEGRPGNGIDENISLLSLDDNKKGKILCLLQLSGLRLINHECQFAKDTVNPYGVNKAEGETLYHDIRISFEKCERVKSEISV
jgi:hypothetical protein